MTGFRWGLLLLIPLIAGCAQTVPPPNLHVLSALPRDAASGPGSMAASRGPVVGVEQANIPEYLDRPEIVVRTSADTLELMQGDRWGQRLPGRYHAGCRRKPARTAAQRQRLCPAVAAAGTGRDDGRGRYHIIRAGRFRQRRAERLLGPCLTARPRRSGRGHARDIPNLSREKGPRRPWRR